MKSIVLKENLRQGLQIGERISGKSVSLPILSNILLRGIKNILKIFLVLLNHNFDCFVSVTYNVIG